MTYHQTTLNVFSEIIHYNLRNNRNIKLPFSRLESFRRSFFPRAIRLWNALSLKIRDEKTLIAFKTALKKDNDEQCNVLYYYGERWASVHHARIRMGCSKLNSDLCFKLHVSDDPSCECGHPLENSNHYFFTCQIYNEQREILHNSILNIAPLTLELLTFGSSELTLQQNTAIFTAVQQFIRESGRF